jgi:branched-chain amino acid transport system permease protein
MDFASILSGALGELMSPTTAAYALASLGLAVHFGYSGLLNFGQAGFMAVGAYGFAISTLTFKAPFFLALLIAVVAAALFALILGIPTLRLRADYLAIVTIAAAEIVRYLVTTNGWTAVTGSANGLAAFEGGFFEMNPFPPGSYAMGMNNRDFFIRVVGWTLVIVAGVLVWLLMRSPWGRVLKGIREDENAVRSLGKNVYAYKMQSLALGGVIGAVAGMMQAIQVQSVNPDNYDPGVTFFLYTLLVLGGAGRILGPVVGSILFWFVLSFLDSALRQAIDAGHISPDLISTSEVGAVRFALVGVALILLVAFRPQGILGSRKEMLLSGR